MRFLFFCVVLVIDLVVVTASSAQNVNWGAKSSLLDTGMTEEQIIKLVGSRPTKVEMEFCGPSTNTWHCKIHTYGDLSHHLTVYFQRTSDGIWRVIRWTVFRYP